MIKPKWATIFGAVSTVILLIGSGAIALPLGIEHSTGDVIKSWFAFIGAISNGMMTAASAYSSKEPGPLTH
jgi:hypothetical protein